MAKIIKTEKFLKDDEQKKQTEKEKKFKDDERKNNVKTDKNGNVIKYGSNEEEIVPDERN